MIGNWVKIKGNYGKPLKITTIDDTYNSINYFDGDAEGELTLQLNEIEPTPITPEILEKNGFGKFDFPDIEKQHKWFLRLDTLSYISLWTRELNDNSSNGWMCNIEKQPAASGCVMIVYTHELQHLLKLVGINKEIQI